MSILCCLSWEFEGICWSKALWTWTEIWDEFDTRDVADALEALRESGKKKEPLGEGDLSIEDLDALLDFELPSSTCKVDYENDSARL